MPRTRGGAAREGPPLNVQHPAESTDHRSRATVARPVDELAAWRERRAWLAAAQHLDARGLPPCVPCELVGWLRGYGIPAWCQDRAS
jgi:hypothetical protein